MFKRAIILVVLSSVLFTLIVIKNHTANPVNKTVSNDTASSEYITKEYTISKIKGNHYYGKNENGTGIRFADKSIVSGDNINVNDVVVCYFEKDNLGKGIVKVEKK
ncbi:hypothetical protein BIV60_15190 [Bacillus sp. MUM 116]|uniref:hypothetical protein n=1 Tax=Bacillus sp. MUM 116 TaxID=1678002 RepID=UPI0008F5F409|nr:hypothetical protein [Bacillus sp. MUM 116]OIK13020.1 hypothetical protein BIV60_15190 [Bacillus sp. MUM 116]